MYIYKIHKRKHDERNKLILAIYSRILRISRLFKKSRMRIFFAGAEGNAPEQARSLPEAEFKGKSRGSVSKDDKPENTTRTKKTKEKVLPKWKKPKQPKWWEGKM